MSISKAIVELHGGNIRAESAGRGLGTVFSVELNDLGFRDGNGIDLMLQLSNDYGLRGIALTGYGMAEDIARTEQAVFWRIW